MLEPMSGLDICLVPLYFAADVEAALASQSDFVNVPTQSHAAD